MAFPAYRAIVYAPRRIDPTESTPLTPTAGAPHSEPFQVASVAGLTGFKPYLRFPRGKTGEIKLLSRKTDAGEQTFSLADADLTPGVNEARFFTAFAGDAEGNNLLNGCLFRAWESLDFDPANPLAATWTPFWTGRVQTPALDGRVSLTLTVRDASAGVNHKVFTHPPHSSITYARSANVLPNGFVGTYGPNPAAAWLKGEVRTVGYANAYEGAVVLDGAPGQDWATTAIMQVDAESYWSVDGTRGTAHPSARVYVKRLDTNAGGWFRLGKIRGTTWLAVHLRRYFDVRTDNGSGGIGDTLFAHNRVRAFGLQELLPGEAGYMPLPPAGTEVEAYVVPGSKRSETVPLIIDTVQAAAFIADVCAGKFARLKPDGSIYPQYVIPFNSAGSVSVNGGLLVDDTTLPTIRLIVDKGERARDLISDVCMWAGLAWRMNGAGELELIDLRQPSTVPAATAIGTDDIDRSVAPQWSAPSADQVTRADFTYYVDTQVTADEIARTRGAFPDVPPGLIRSEAVPFQVVDLAEEAINQEQKALEVDARGVRVWIAYGPDDGLREGVLDTVRARLSRMEAELRGPYAYAPQFVSLTCFRTPAVTSCNPGDLRFVSVPEIVNTLTNRRGGSVLLRVLSRTDDEMRVTLKCLVLPNAVAVAPVLGAVSATTDGRDAKVSVPVTLNAAGEAVEVEIAITATSVGARPAATAAVWQGGRFASASGTFAVQDQPVGYRAWIRARSNPSITRGGAPKYPSAYVFPPGAGYVDTVEAPQLLTGRVLVDDATGAADVAWTPTGAGAVAVRIHYGIGPDNGSTSPPAITSSVDTNATTPTLPGVVVPRGQRIAVEVEPWSGWTGSAVAGTAGARKMSDAGRATAPPAGVEPPAVAVDRTADNEADEVWSITASLSPGAAAPLRWRTYEAGTAPGAFNVEASGAVATSLTIPRYEVRSKVIFVDVVDGDGRPKGTSIIVSARHRAVDPGTGRVIDPPSLSVNRTTDNVADEVWSLTASLSPGAAGPLRWRTFEAGTAPGAFTTEASGTVTTSLTLARYEVRSKVIFVDVVDGDEHPTRAVVTVSGRHRAVDPGTGKVDPGVPLHGTSRGIFTKASPTDPDDADSIPGGTLRRIPGTGYVDTSGRVNTLWDSSYGVARGGGAIGEGVKRATDGLSSAGRLRTGVDPEADVAGRSATLLRSSANGVVFEETFDNLPPGIERRMGAPGTLAIVAGVGDTGGSVIQATGFTWDVFPQLIVFDRTKLYEFTAQVRSTAHSLSANDYVYFGIEGVAADSVTLVNTVGANLSSDQHYLGAAAVNLATYTVGQWVEVKGWFAARAATGASTPSTDPLNPAAVQDGVRYMRPLMILNYSGGDGVMQVDRITIRQHDRDLSQRGYGALLQGGIIRSTAAVEGTGRSMATVDGNAVAGKAADTDLSAFATAGAINRLDKHVLQVRDTARNVNVSGAQAATGFRLVDPTDAGVRLPPTEVSAGALPADVGASDGTVYRAITKGMEGPFMAFNGVTLSFTTPYQDVPPVVLGPWTAMEDRAKWGTQAQCDAGTAATAKPVAYIRMVDLGTLTAGAYTPKLYFMAEQLPVGKQMSFASPTTVSVIGAATGSAQPADADVPSVDGKFRATFTLSISNFGNASGASGTVVVALQVNLNVGGWTEIGTQPVSYHLAAGASGTPTAYVVEGLAAAVDGGNDDFRVQYKSKSGGATSVSVAVGSNALKWEADAGALYALVTPGGERHAVPVHFMARA